MRAGAFVLAGLLALAAMASACASGTSPSTQPAASTASATAPVKAAKKTAHRVSTGIHKPKRNHHRKRLRAVARRPAGVARVDMPNPALTPGAAFAVGRARICMSGYASSVRDVPESEKDAVYARYGVPHVPYQHEVDHLVSLEIGGSNAMSNLWPEPYAGRWGARTKDVLEDRLHDLVCSGTIGLRHAQRIEARNWVAAYRRYVGSPPVATSSGGSGQLRRRRARQRRWRRLHPRLFAVPAVQGRRGLRLLRRRRERAVLHRAGSHLYRHRQRSVPPRRQRRRQGVRVGA